MSFFISDALAAATTAPQANQLESYTPMLMLVLMFAFVYFMLLRPQNKRAKAHKEMVDTLKKGDEVITNGGIYGKVVDVDDQIIKVSVAEGVEINLQRSAVNTVLPKGTIKSL